MYGNEECELSLISNWVIARNQSDLFIIITILYDKLNKDVVKKFFRYVTSMKDVLRCV